MHLHHEIKWNSNLIKQRNLNRLHCCIKLAFHFIYVSLYIPILYFTLPIYRSAWYIVRYHLLLYQIADTVGFNFCTYKSYVFINSYVIFLNWPTHSVTTCNFTTTGWITTSLWQFYTVLHCDIWPASWSSGQGLWLLIMRSWVGFPVLPWEFFLAGKDSRGDHGLGS